MKPLHPLYISVYIVSSQLKPTRDPSLTKASPLWSRANARFVLLPQSSLVLPQCSPLLHRPGPRLRYSPYSFAAPSKAALFPFLTEKAITNPKFGSYVMYRYSVCRNMLATTL